MLAAFGVLAVPAVPGMLAVPAVLAVPGMLAVPAVPAVPATLSLVYSSTRPCAEPRLPYGVGLWPCKL